MIAAWTSLCKPPDFAIRPGMSRNQVHETLKEKFYTGSDPDAGLSSGYLAWSTPRPSGSRDLPAGYASRRLGGALELYQGLFPSGTMSWFGPASEGLVGKKKNYVSYVLEIDYDPNGVVQRCAVLKRNQRGRYVIE